MLITQALVGESLTDVRIDAGRVTSLAPRLRPRPGEEVIDAEGGSLLPGLHDHHLHLLATAAAMNSVDCESVPNMSSRDFTRSVLAAAAVSQRSTGVRVIGYHEKIAGALTSAQLDQLVFDRPLRVQHRSGALWYLNSMAMQRARLADVPGLTAFQQAEASVGRLWRADQLLRHPDDYFPSLDQLGQQLARHGITGVTDATPDLATTAVGRLASAVRARILPVRVMLLGSQDLTPTAGITVGPRKLVLTDHELPGLDQLTDAIESARTEGNRNIAVHTVTRESLLLLLAALARTGSMIGDRFEHAAVVPFEVRDEIRRLGARVVTQPSFIHTRGDDYLSQVDPDDRRILYPYGSLLRAGIRTAPSSDAPYGELNPWRTVLTASTRRTRAGVVFNKAERVTRRTVLEGFFSDAPDPGGPPRSVREGARADLCLLRSTLDEMLAAGETDPVRATIAGGYLSYLRP